jgi:hypothetical protein
VSKKFTKNSSKIFVKKVIPKEPQGHQSNNDFYVIYKSGPFVPGQSRFLEASLVRKRTASLKNVFYADDCEEDHIFRFLNHVFNQERLLHCT